MSARPDSAHRDGPPIRELPRLGRQTIPWGEARRSAAECAMHSPVESSRGEKRGVCGVKPRDSGLSRGEKRILLLGPVDKPILAAARPERLERRGAYVATGVTN
jgi:hypothetical protein